MNSIQGDHHRPSTRGGELLGVAMHGPKPVLDLEKSTLNRNPGYDGQGYTTENPITRSLKRRWDAEDAMRDQVERQVKNKFLEEHANQIFASIEGFLARLDKVLHTTGAAIKINPIWENRDAEALRRADDHRRRQPSTRPWVNCASGR